MELAFSTLKPKQVGAGGHVVLYVEDSDIDHEALMRAIARLGLEIKVVRCTDAQEARDYLQRQGPYQNGGHDLLRPTLILLDLNLPAEGGQTLLKFLKTNVHLAAIPVIVLSSSESPKDVKSCYELGANAYLLKTINSRDLEPKLLALVQFWLTQALLPGSGMSSQGTSIGSGEGW